MTAFWFWTIFIFIGGAVFGGGATYLTCRAWMNFSDEQRTEETPWERG